MNFEPRKKRILPCHYSNNALGQSPSTITFEEPFFCRVKRRTLHLVYPTLKDASDARPHGSTQKQFRLIWTATIKVCGPLTKLLRYYDSWHDTNNTSAPLNRN